MSAYDSTGVGMASMLEQLAKVGWSKAEGFYWNGFIKEVEKHLTEDRKEEEVDVVDPFCCLIKYKVRVLKDLQNVGHGNYDKFAEKLSAEGVPDRICELLFESNMGPKKRSASGEIGRSSKHLLRELFYNNGFFTLSSNGIDIDKPFWQGKS